MTNSTVNTSMPTWQEWQNQVYSNLAQKACSDLDGYYTPMLGNGYSEHSSVTSSSSSNSGYESQDVYEQRIREQNKQRSEYVTARDESEPGYHINMTATEKKACIEQEQVTSSNAHKDEINLLASLGFSSVFVAPATYKLIKGKCYGANEGVTQLFYSPANAKLFEEAPTTMINAQEALTKASRQHMSALAHCKGDKGKTKQIKNGYKYLETLMKDALKSGDADTIAKATAQIQAANSKTYFKTRFKIPTKKLNNVTKNTLATEALNTKAVTNAKAITGNSFVKKLGGKAGIGMGVVMAGLTLFLSKNDIKEAYEKDKETGKKQLWHSIGKAVVPVVTFTGGDALGKWLVTKIISKGAGKALGAAIGSCVPVLGTAVGLILGCVFDWAVSYFGPKLIAAIKHEDQKFAYNSPIENARIEAKTDEELFDSIATKKIQNQDLTPMETELIAKNQEAYNNFVAKVQAQLAQQQQTVATA